MKQYLSNVFYDKYFNLNNRNIEVKLKNGKCIQGVIIGFFKDENKQIIKWHIVSEKDKTNLGIDSFGQIKGKIIVQRDIETITFIEDNSVMHF